MEEIGFGLPEDTGGGDGGTGLGQWPFDSMNPFGFEFGGFSSEIPFTITSAYLDVILTLVITMFKFVLLLSLMFMIVL